jgi:predicted Zn-dependent protease
MALDLPKLRKLLAIDPNDPLSRFALGKKLMESAGTPDAPDESASLTEAADHLRVANAKSPDHLATYHILAQVLLRIGKEDEARVVLTEGIAKASLVTEGMGRDLAPLMRQMLADLSPP